MLSVLLSALLIQAAPSAPHAAAANCTTFDRSLPASLAPWLEPSALEGPLRPGHAVPVTPGAAVTLEIAEAGTYGVAIGIPAWIEVTRDGQALASTGHGHGPDCTTIRKIVDFRLEPGRYTITLSRTSAPTSRLLVIRR